MVILNPVRLSARIVHCACSSCLLAVALSYYSVLNELSSFSGGDSLAWNVQTVYHPRLVFPFGKHSHSSQAVKAAFALTL